MKKLHKWLISVGLVGAVCFSSCNVVPLGNSSGELGEVMKQMDSAEKAYKKRLEQEALAFMSLETMFPDERVRALAQAAARGDIKKVDALVAEGVDVNSVGKRGATPLYWAMRSYKGTEHLLELGANPNLIYEDGTTILTVAVELKDIRVMRVLLEHRADPNLKPRAGLYQAPIFDAMYYGMNRVDLLLAHGADINILDRFGCTPLMSACSVADYDIAYELLLRGADYSIRDENGYNISDYIRRSRLMTGTKYYARMVRVAEYLRERGVDVVLPHEVPPL